MDLDSLKGKTLDDKLHGELVAHVAELAAQRDAARKESIDGRKGKDQKIKDLEARLSAVAEWAGIEPDADLAALPAPKGQADAAKQYEAKLARLTRERDDALKLNGEMDGKLRGMRRDAAIAGALDGFRFKNPADVRVLIERHVQEEGDELLFKTDDGKLVPLKEGAAWFAKTRPDYVHPADAGGAGSGFKGSGAGNGGSGKNESGSFVGDPAARAAAIRQKFPELAQA